MYVCVCIYIYIYDNKYLYIYIYMYIYIYIVQMNEIIKLGDSVRDRNMASDWVGSESSETVRAARFLPEILRFCLQAQIRSRILRAIFRPLYAGVFPLSRKVLPARNENLPRELSELHALSLRSRATRASLIGFLESAELFHRPLISPSLVRCSMRMLMITMRSLKVLKLTLISWARTNTEILNISSVSFESYELRTNTHGKSESAVPEIHSLKYRPASEYHSVRFITRWSVAFYQRLPWMGRINVTYTCIYIYIYINVLVYYIILYYIILYYIIL